MPNWGVRFATFDSDSQASISNFSLLAMRFSIQNP